MLLELAEQSIQLLTCHISRWRLCQHSPQDNQSKSWKKSVISVFLSLITSHAVGTSRAEHTTSYRGRATTSFISYHQLKTWALLSKDNQSKSWEKVWAKKNWNCLSWVNSLSSFTTRQPIQVLKKRVTSVFFVIDYFSLHKHQQSRAYNFLHFI